MFGLLQLMWLLSSEDALPGWCVINKCWREQRGTEMDSFPLAIVSINLTCLAFDALTRGKLAAHIEAAHKSGTEMAVLKVLPPAIEAVFEFNPNHWRCILLFRDCFCFFVVFWFLVVNLTTNI
jgi:hypothetical protein